MSLGNGSLETWVEPAAGLGGVSTHGDAAVLFVASQVAVVTSSTHTAPPAVSDKTTAVASAGRGWQVAQMMVPLGRRQP